jgi:hypothetical protein
MIQARRSKILTAFSNKPHTKKKLHNSSIREFTCLAELVLYVPEKKKKQVCCLTVNYSLGEVRTEPFEESNDVGTHKRQVKTCKKQPRKTWFGVI